MADIKERIKKISPYFKGMQVDDSDGEQVIYVMVSFPSSWIIQEDIPNKFDISIASNNGVYYFCASLEQGFDILFDAIEYNIEKMKIAIERTNLFKTKMGELKNLFEDETIPIEALRTLEFTYKVKKNKSKTPTIITAPKPVPPTEEMIEEDEETIVEPSGRNEEEESAV